MARGFGEAWEASARRGRCVPVGRRGVEKMIGGRRTAGGACETEGHPDVGDHVTRGRRRSCGRRHHHQSRCIGAERGEPCERRQDLDVPLALTAEGTPRGVDVRRGRIVNGRGRW